MADRGESEIPDEPADLATVRLPRDRGLDREVDEVESVLVDSVYLLEDATPGKVHCADQHRAMITRHGRGPYPRGMETYEAIMTRRSGAKTTDRVPDKAAIQRLLDAAVAAPNHHLTEPWRFVVLSGDALKELGAAWAAGEERGGGDPEKVRDKPLRAPVIITMIERPKAHLPKVVEIEEHHAVGAAMQNMLLAAHDAGLAAMLRTGEAAHFPEVRDHLGLQPNEFVAGFIYVGYTPEDYARKPPRKTSAAELTEWRGW